MKLIAQRALLLILMSTLSFGDEYAVIANKKMNDLTKEQIKAIYLKRLTLIDDIKIVPVNLSARNPLRERFEQEVLHISLPRLKSYWIKQHYLGHRPPVDVQSQESAIAFVKKVEGAIAYINVQYLDNDIKVIYRWSD